MMRNICIFASLLLLLNPTWCQSNFTKYVYYSEEKNWLEAQAFCRESHIDLATCTDAGIVLSATWIGLYRDREDKLWKWSRGTEPIKESYWDLGEPKDHKRCGLLSPKSRGWMSDSCGKEHAFLCFDNFTVGKENTTGGGGVELVQGEGNKTIEEEEDKKFVLVKESKTWEEAVEHCRSLGGENLNGSWSHYDLATLSSPDDHIYARGEAREATSEEVWTGLRFLAGGWWWVGGEDVLYQDLQSCSLLTACGVLEKRGNASFQIRGCEERRNFICYRKP